MIKLLLKDGLELISMKGIHHKITKGGKTEIIPVHSKDIKKGLLSAILKRTGLEVNKSKQIKKVLYRLYAANLK